MGFYHLQRGHVLNSRSLLRLLVPLLLALLFIFTTRSAGAQDAQPVDTINPVQSEPAIGYLHEDISLDSKNNVLDEKLSNQCSSQPSWWNWLVNASSKPANFHYIDIMELLN